MATVQNLNYSEEKKQSFFLKLFNGIKYLLLLLFPVISALRLNSQLSLAQSIYHKKDKKILRADSLLSILKLPFVAYQEKENFRYNEYMKEITWFTKQKFVNLIFGIILTLPLIIAISTVDLMITQDGSFMKRLSAVDRKSKTFREKISNYYYTVADHPNDSDVRYEKKYHTKVILTRSLIILGLGILFQFGGGFIFVFDHPIQDLSQQLRNLLISNGLRKKEDDDKMIAIYTPLGVLVDITGNTPREVASLDRIWSSLNIKIKEWSEDPSKRSLVFFKKEYELKDSYNYKIEDIKKLIGNAPRKD